MTARCRACVCMYVLQPRATSQRYGYVMMTEHVYSPNTAISPTTASE